MKQIITTTKAPAPIGPYNQAVLSGNTLYTSGQIALHPETGDLVLDSITIETEQVGKYESDDPRSPEAAPQAEAPPGDHGDGRNHARYTDT